MKRLILIVLVAFIGISTQAQTYKLNKSTGAITKVDSTKKKVKTPDKVYKIVDGVTFYKGAKGGIYYYKTSKKTGKTYKCYVKD